MNSIIRLTLLTMFFLENIGFPVLANPVSGQAESIEEESSWDLLGFGTMSKEAFILTCILIAAGIFIVVVLFAIFIFIVEAQEFKALSKKTSNDCRNYCNAFEMEKRAMIQQSMAELGAPQGRVEEAGTNKRFGFIALDNSNPTSTTSKKVHENLVVTIMDRMPLHVCTRGDGYLAAQSVRRSMDEVSFKTIPEEDELQAEDFHSIIGN